MDATDGLVGEALPVDVGADEPTVLLEINIELLEVVGGQLLHLNITQRWDDVLIGYAVRMTSVYWDENGVSYNSDTRDPASRPAGYRAWAD